MQVIEGYRHIVYLGFSMGCFGSLLLACMRLPDAIIATSPSYPPGCIRDPSHFASDDMEIKKPNRALVQYDSHYGSDEISARRFSAAIGGARMVDLAGGGHPATEKIVRDGKYCKLLDHWLSPRFDYAFIRSLND